MKARYILMAVIIPMLFWGCDDTDDVAGIFLGKTWKLTGILVDSSSPYPSDYWNGDEAAKAKSYELLQDANKFIIKFDGAVIDGTISGICTGYASSTTISGDWSADGDKNTFGTSNVQVGNDSDPLGAAFIYGLRSAYKYLGDYDNLSIYFKENGRTKYLLFRVQE